MPRILVATPDGLHTLDERGSAGPVHYTGRAVTTIAPARKELWAVVEGSEVWHTADIDRWAHVAGMEGHRATCIAAIGDDVFVGSSEARLFRVADQVLEPIVPFDHVEGRSAWYTPWGGPPDTRSIANWDEVVFVNVHVGGVLRTEDRGETWTPRSTSTRTCIR